MSDFKGGINMYKKVKEWEYDDVMHDYLQWQDELERLLDEDEPDEDAINEAKKMVAYYEDALYSEQQEKDKKYILEQEDAENTLMEDIIQNVLETSAWEDEGYYNEDDIRLAIGRELMARLRIEVQP